MLPRHDDRVRPLLFESRDVLEAWAEHRGLRWTNDPSNPASERGRIRATMPALEALRAGASSALARSARLIARDDALLDAITETRWAEISVDGGLPVEPWSGEPDAIRLRLLLRLARAIPHGVTVRGDRLERLLTGALKEDSRVVLSGGWELRVVDGALVVRAPSTQD